MIGSGSTHPAVGQAQGLLGPSENYGGLLSFRYVVPMSAVLAIVFGSVAGLLLVRVLELSPYAAWAALIAMNNIHFLSVFYRYRTGKWKKVKLID